MNGPMGIDLAADSSVDWSGDARKLEGVAIGPARVSRDPV